MSTLSTNRQMHGPGAADAIDLLADGTLTPEALFKACVEHIEMFDLELGAWAFLDPNLALAQARAVDARRARSQSVGPPNGIPVGIKDIHRTIMETELAHDYEPYYSRGADAVSPMLRRMTGRGRERPAAEFTVAVEKLTLLHSTASDMFHDVDVILTLAATGSPVFSTPWTVLGLPAISLPLLHGASGMPIGAQLITAYGDDVTLLRVAYALETEAGQ